MAIGTDDSDVCAGQRKSRFFVPGERKSSGFEVLQVVTGLAAVLVWRTRELTLVNVLVAILALRLGDFEERVLVFWPLWDMTFIAGNLDVLTLEGIFRAGVILDSKNRGFETFNGVAHGTFAAIRACAELPLMRIFVAVRTLREWHRRLEIPMGVALGAFNSGVLAEQREFCLGMIEAL